jgi:hypothetical protein
MHATTPACIRAAVLIAEAGDLRARSGALRVEALAWRGMARATERQARRLRFEGVMARERALADCGSDSWQALLEQADGPHRAGPGAAQATAIVPCRSADRERCSRSGPAPQQRALHRSWPAPARRALLDGVRLRGYGVQKP